MWYLLFVELKDDMRDAATDPVILGSRQIKYLN